MREFEKNVIYKGEQYRVENVYYEPVSRPGYFNLYIYKKCEDDIFRNVFEWKDYEKEFNNYINSTNRLCEKRLDIYEKLYITLIKDAFKRYEDLLETERMEQTRLEELDDWDGVIEL